MRKHTVLFQIAIAVLSVVIFLQCSTQKKKRAQEDESGNPNTWDASVTGNANEMMEKGKAVFRFETFGDEVFWTDKLQLHKVIADKGAGGTGEGLSPKKALELGLKVDLDVLRKVLKMQIRD